MSALSKIGEKRGLSNLVAYVLLISITIALSVMVYGWLKFYVEGEDVVTCSDKVNVIINDYECFSGVDGSLNVSLKNKGLFSIDGYILRVHDRPDADFGFYTLDNSGFVLAPGEEVDVSYDFSDYDGDFEHNLESVTLVEVQPFIMEEGKVSCESYSSQRVVCN